MRTRRFVTRLAMVGLIAGLATLLGSGSSPAVAQECVVLIESTTSFTPGPDVPPAGPSAGDSFSFTANLVDPVTDQNVGTSSGFAVTTRVSNGQAFAFIVETLTLTDRGKVKAFGPFNQTALQSGTPQTINAVGLSGEFAGQTGTLTNAPIQQGLATLTLCLS